MFALWGCYFLLNFFHFEEPDRQSAAYAATQPPKKREVMLTKQHSACENTPLITEEVTGSPENVQIADQLPSGNKTAHSIRGQMTSCFGHIPVMVSLLLLMLLKSVLEGISSSAPTLSRHYFHWGVDASGAYLAFLASMVLPTTGRFIRARVAFIVSLPNSQGLLIWNSQSLWLNLAVAMTTESSLWPC